MASAAIKQGGTCIVSSTVSAAAPLVLICPQADSTNAPGIDPDGTNAQAVKFTNTGTTDGSATSSSWLWLRQVSCQPLGTGTPVLPGDSFTMVAGENSNRIGTVVGWLTAPGSTSNASSNICVAAGTQKASV